MKLWCPTTKVLLVLPCSQEEYDELLNSAVLLSCSQAEYDELLKYAVMVPNCWVFFVFTGGVWRTVEVCSGGV